MDLTGYLTTVILTGIVCTAVAVVLVLLTVRLILRQIKLYHSIHLVELKTNKIAYWTFAIVIGFLIFYVIMHLADAYSPGILAFYDLFGVDSMYANIVFLFVLLALVATEAFLIVLAVSRSAVVDKGVYTNSGMLDWHNVRDYIIDEERGVLILSSDKDTFRTLKNITAPFRVAKSDIEKLKFILNKNKNKFSGFEAGNG